MRCCCESMSREYVSLFLEIFGLNYQPLVVLVIKNVLVGRVAEHAFPTVGVEVWKIIDGGRNSRKPIVEDEVELRRYITRLRVEDNWNGDGMFR